jgi:hypothetical protein
LPVPTVTAFGLDEMSSLDLAVLVTARHRTVRQALKAASLLADRHARPDLERSIDMLCRSYDPGDQLLGLHLCRRYVGVQGSIPPAFALLIRTLAREADGKVAASARLILAACRTASSQR